MKPSCLVFRFSLLILFIGVGVVSCMPHRHPTEPRVAPEKLEQAKALKAPFGDAKSASPEVVTEGKRLFDSKGCVHCHGLAGKGNGAAASKLVHHPPRDFSDCKWQDKRTDGELFWVLDHGVPGTGMVDQVPHHMNEAQAWKVVAYLRTLCASG
jgi:mono/diheme cytochrome c family protein